jgi:hypothetical protein
MQGVLIYAPHDYDAIFEARLTARFGPTRQRENEQWLIERENSRVYIYRDLHIREYLESEAEKRVLAEMPQLVAYAVNFSDIGLVREVLLAIADDPELVVDNDMDVILRGPAFLQQLRERPDWDWVAESYARWQAEQDEKVDN